MVSRKEIEQADERAARRREAGPLAVEARYDRRIGRVVVTLNTGVEIAFPPRLAQGLEAARPADLERIEISPSGLGLHFPSLDADLYLPALLEGIRGSRKWMASELGREGGRARSKAKSAASRANGKRGGRPRKKVRFG